MNLLLLGGTLFLGRHVVDAALARGHAVTLFHRGKTGADLFPELEHLTGDRDGGLEALRGRSFDAVVDTCGYVPRIVRDSARLLADTCGHYAFVSSGSVYPHPVAPGTDETGTIGTLEDPTVEEVTGETYGPLKALCEAEATAAFGDRALSVRAGLIVGPHDQSDRFTYWPTRVAAGRDVLGPARPEQPVQFIDARDMAAWMVRMAERRQGGVFNVTGPAEPLRLSELLDECVRVTGSDAEFVQPSAAFLEEQSVQLWVDLPLTLGPEDDGFCGVSIARALAAGLTFRPLAETIADTAAWAAEARPDGVLRTGISREREAELLAAWHARS